MAALRLYRRILRLHRHVLPPEMRKMGDAYVQAEFHRHKTADAAFIDGFLNEWTRYAEQLETQALGIDATGFGKDLDADVVSTMTDEQRQQLQQLRQAAEDSTRS